MGSGHPGIADHARTYARRPGAAHQSAAGGPSLPTISGAACNGVNHSAGTLQHDLPTGLEPFAGTCKPAPPPNLPPRPPTPALVNSPIRDLRIAADAFPESDSLTDLSVLAIPRPLDSNWQSAQQVPGQTNLAAKPVPSAPGSRWNHQLGQTIQLRISIHG